MATVEVACPYCGSETNATTQSNKKIAAVRKSKTPPANIPGASHRTQVGCPEGHSFYAFF